MLVKAFIDETEDELRIDTEEFGMIPLGNITHQYSECDVVDVDISTTPKDGFIQAVAWTLPNTQNTIWIKLL